MTSSADPPDNIEQLSHQFAVDYAARWDARKAEVDDATERIGGVDAFRDRLGEWASEEPDVATMFEKILFTVEMLVSGRELDPDSLQKAWEQRSSGELGPGRGPTTG